uniref:phospholipase A2 n=1 Tax=Meloidogyne javanica TaxID=6303 RepID=A0A915LDG6_MELJA
MSLFNKENLQKFGRFANALNTGLQAAQAAQQVFQAVNGTGTQNGTTNQQLQPSQREITFVQPNAAEKGDKNKSLFGEFNEEFLKKNLSLINQHRDSDGSTPLICAVLRKCLDSVVLLLSNGASVNATDSKGNTALHYADTPQIVKALIIFRADLNIKNKAGNDCLSGRKRQEITQILLKAKLWDELKIIENATTTSPSLQTKINEHKQQIAIQCQFRKDLEDKKRSLRLLSLDGGGIKGLVLIQILMELEDICGNTENFVTKNFDWIAGTSTGAILALALADGYKPIQCLRLYLRLKDEIFLTRSNPLVPYPDEKIEKFLKENFGETRKMADIKNKKLK